MAEKKKIRALHICGDSKFGGGDIVVCSILQMLQEHGVEATLQATDPSAKEYASACGLRVWPFEGICREIRPLHDLATVLRLAKVLRGNYEIVHTNTTKGGMIGRAAAWLARVPVVLHTVHGFAFHEFTGPVKTSILGFAERVLGKMCDKVVFVNSLDRQKALDMHIIPADKGVTVYNGLPEDRLAPGRDCTREELLREMSLPADAVLGVFVGRLAQQKGLPYLFEAMKIVAQRRPDLQYHQAIIGEGELESQCRQWAQENNVTDRVHFLGFRSDAVRWTGGCDLFVLPSLWEGHSITLLEAMGLGKPIVATDIKGNCESLTSEKDGLLVAPANAESLAEGIIRLASDRNFALQLGAAARRTFEERFTLRHMLDGFWEVYRGLLEQKGLL